MYIGTLLKSNMEIPHHFVHFPLDFNTAAIRLGIDSLSLLQSSTVIEGKVSSTRDHNSSIPFGGVSYRWFNLLFKIAHRFSIGFKSGDCAGLDKTPKGCLEIHCLILLLLCIGALSY